MRATSNSKRVYLHACHAVWWVWCGVVWCACRPGWKAALSYPQSAQLGALSLFTTPPIRVMERRLPTRIYTVTEPSASSDVHVWNFDFGQNWAGFTTLRVPAGVPAGTKLTIRHTEITHSDGSLYNTYCGAELEKTTPCAQPPWASNYNLSSGNTANQTEVYITKGTQGPNEETYTPTFTYHGFRYASLEGLPPGITPDNRTLTSLFLHSDTKQIGHIKFKTGSPPGDLLNRLQAAILYTQHSNQHTIPTDCPTREKRGWTGDAQWTSEEASLNFATAAFYRNFVRSMGDSQAVGCTPWPYAHTVDHTSTRKGAPPGTRQSRPANYRCCDPTVHPPSFGCDFTGVTDNFTDYHGDVPDAIPYGEQSGYWGGWPGDRSFAASGAEIPFQAWVSSGDHQVLLEGYTVARALVEFNNRHRDRTLHLPLFGHYGDWQALTTATPKGAVESFSAMLALNRTAQMAAALGKKGDAARYTAMLTTYKTAWHAAYFNSSTVTYAGDTQTGNAMALYLEVPPTAAVRVQVVRALARSYSNATLNGSKANFGTVGARIFLPVLATTGLMDLAIDFATKTTQPSYGYMIDQGPGTLWEQWHGDAHTAFGSKNHIMFGGGLGVFLYRLAGLGYDATHDRVSLVIDAAAVVRVGGATAVLETPRGRVAWEWRLEERAAVTEQTAGGAGDAGDAGDDRQKEERGPGKKKRCLLLNMSVPYGLGKHASVVFPKMPWATQLVETFPKDLGASIWEDLVLATELPVTSVVWCSTKCVPMQDPVATGNTSNAAVRLLASTHTQLHLELAPGQYSFELRE